MDIFTFMRVVYTRSQFGVVAGLSFLHFQNPFRGGDFVTLRNQLKTGQVVAKAEGQ